MPTTATAAAQNSGIIETSIQFIQDGGFFMYPILIVLALGLALSLERIIYLQATKAKEPENLERRLSIDCQGSVPSGAGRGQQQQHRYGQGHRLWPGACQNRTPS